MGNLSQNFSRWEFACKCGCGFATADIELIEVLEDVRKHFNNSVTINSGSRCIVHNKSVGGDDRSKHLEGIASDIVVANIASDTVQSYLRTKYPDKYGIGMYDGRTHIDVRQFKARWDKRT